jgi:hypothetical protein
MRGVAEMLRRSLADEGLICEDPSVKDMYQPTMSRAWQCACKVRTALADRDWERADRFARRAATTATEALLYSRGYRPVGELTIDDACDYCAESFGMRTRDLFTRARIIGEFLPLSDDLDDDTLSFTKRAMIGSSEVVALVECKVSVEQAARERAGGLAAEESAWPSARASRRRR